VQLLIPSNTNRLLHCFQFDPGLAAARWRDEFTGPHTLARFQILVCKHRL
jgi:hypothetical protein